jgi:hypothetical protein
MRGVPKFQAGQIAKDFQQPFSENLSFYKGISNAVGQRSIGTGGAGETALAHFGLCADNGSANERMLERSPWKEGGYETLYP